MHARLLLVPATAVAISAPAVGMQLQSLEAAQLRLCPGATLTPADFRLTDDQYEQLKGEFHVPVMRPAVKAWRVSTGGWLFLDQVYGLNDVITYLVAISDDSKVRGIEILVCSEGFCGIAAPEWRAEFVGKTPGNWNPPEAVTNVSGASLYTVNVTEGVKKLLIIQARFLPPSIRP